MLGRVWYWIEVWLVGSEYCIVGVGILQDSVGVGMPTERIRSVWVLRSRSGYLQVPGIRLVKAISEAYIIC